MQDKLKKNKKTNKQTNKTKTKTKKQRLCINAVKQSEKAARD